jgi:hypothetical protein
MRCHPMFAEKEGNYMLPSQDGLVSVNVSMRA